MTYANDLASAKACATIVPVIVLQLVDFDALSIIGRWSSKCHPQADTAHCLAPELARCVKASSAKLVQGFRV